MKSKATSVALAFVGLTVGAGFASGQEVMQYFVGFGIYGIFGAIAAALVFAFTGMVIVQLGSYFLATDHNVVLSGVSRPITSKLFDTVITFTLFSIGFVMIAGGGSNLNQQFGLPTWVGAAIITALVISIGMLDVSKVTAVIGALTPVMILFVIVAIGYSLATVDLSIHELDVLARQGGSTLPHWAIASGNYVSLAISLAVSMSIVMGGDIMDPKVAGRGGFAGGLLFGVLLVAVTGALFAQVNQVAGFDMPMLTLVGAIHPWLGFAMSIVIFAMIFNTAIGMYYALASRFSAGNRQRFRILLISLPLVGFGLSFLGFKRLVGYLYPLIGYVGLALIAVLVYSWWQSKATIDEESKRRGRIRRLVRRKLRRDKRFTREHAKRLENEIDESNIDNQDLHEAIVEDVADQLESEGIDYHDPEKPAPIA
ncbi:MAG: hypothetical protein Q4P71_07525 [Actinomycetaceae bacterium]|nr:hypothetical protein [Actinomycetaceae bacterium]